MMLIKMAHMAAQGLWTLLCDAACPSQLMTLIKMAHMTLIKMAKMAHMAGSQNHFSGNSAH